MSTIDVNMASFVDEFEIKIMKAILGTIKFLYAKKCSKNYFCIHSSRSQLVHRTSGPIDFAIGPLRGYRLAFTFVAAG